MNCPSKILQARFFTSIYVGRNNVLKTLFRCFYFYKLLCLNNEIFKIVLNKKASCHSYTLKQDAPEIFQLSDIDDCGSFRCYLRELSLSDDEVPQSFSIRFM